MTKVPFDKILEQARFYRAACLEAANATAHQSVAEQAVRMANQWEKFVRQIGEHAERVTSSQSLIAAVDALLNKTDALLKER
jgi:hypothetical protein